jgi:acyl-CoA synthetase (AMP-forming)/AMP-acid ligase II
MQVKVLLSLSRFLVLEQAIGTSGGHVETFELVESYLRRLEGEPQPIAGIPLANNRSRTRFCIDRVLELIERERITTLPAPPTLYHSLLSAQGERDLYSLRAGVTGAADIPVELTRRVRSELPFQTLMTGYGLTEAGTVTLSVSDETSSSVMVSNACQTLIPAAAIAASISPGLSSTPRPRLQGRSAW